MSLFYVLDQDTRPVLQTQLSDSVGPVDITSGTIEFLYRLRGRPSGSGIFTGVGTIVGDGTTGVAQTTLSGISAGIYAGRWRVTFTDGNVESFPNDSYIMFEITNLL